MKIHEIFYSIQGESTYSGVPCVFVRTTGCNLCCSYCDTLPALSIGQDMSIDDILCAIRSYSHTGFVEVTGGEPLLQPDVYDLFRILHKSGYKILCETNGSLDIGKIPAYVCRVVDVKTPGSGCPDSFMVSNLTHINHHHDNLKFVIDSLDDYEWMKGFLMSHGLWGSHILVSCVEKNINPAIIAQKILSDGLDVRLQIQLHKYIGLK